MNVSEWFFKSRWDENCIEEQNVKKDDERAKDRAMDTPRLRLMWIVGD